MILLLNEYTQRILELIVQFGWVQWMAFATGLLYIYFATKNHHYCWPWGIASSLFWAYASWFQLQLLSDSLLQLIYTVLGIWGWYAWVKNKNKIVKPISQLSKNQWILNILICFILSFLLGRIMQSTQAAYPMIDAFLSIFSLAATFLLIQRKIENWLWWIVLNAINIPLFITRDGHLFAILFLIYFILSLKGWKEWKVLLVKQ